MTSIVDILEVDWYSSGLFVMLGNGTNGRGDATFATPVEYASGDAPAMPVAADLDLDSVPDIVVTSYSGTSPPAAIYYGQGLCGP